MRPIDDPQTIRAFAAEVREDAAAIAVILETLAQHPDDRQSLHEIYRLVHAIKGAAAMVGLSTFSHLVDGVERHLELSVGDDVDATPELLALVGHAVPLFEQYLEVWLAGGETTVIAQGLVAARRRYQGEPETDDAHALAILLDMSGDTPAPSLPRAAATPRLAPIPTVDVTFPADASPDLIEIFTMEAGEHLQAVSRLLGRLAADSSDRESLQEIRRSVHTLKGAAGMIGFKAVTQLSHRMEDVLDRLYEGGVTPDGATITVLRNGGDALEDLIAGHGDDTLAATIVGILDRLASLNLDAAAPASIEPSEAAAAPVASATEESPVTAGERRRRGDRRKGDRRSSGHTVRVPFERLDDLVKLAGELVINRSTFEQHYGGFIQQVDELGLTIARLRRVAQKLEAEYEVRALATTAVAGAQARDRVTTLVTHGFDELEFDRYTEFHLLSRELTETASDIGTVGSRLRDTIGEFESDLTRLGRLTGEVQDKVMQFRMVPLATIATRLERTVRTTAEACGKRADFVLEGENVALDKTVLDAMADPFLHLLRNAVDHGIEAPAVRRARGKHDRGHILVRAFYEGTQVVIQIDDDGAGVDTERIRVRAVERGLSPEAAGQLSDAELLALTFQPGFSTAETISEVSGRGVGLDVVKAQVQRLKGDVRIETTRGQGSRFTIRLPLTLAITRVLLVRAGGQMFALPLAAVEQIVRVDLSSAERIDRDPIIRLGTSTYPIVLLSEALGLPGGEPVSTMPVIIGKAGDQTLAFAVSEIVESRDAVVKTLGTHLRRVHGVTGATLLGDGSVVLILNPADLGRVAPDRPATATLAADAWKDNDLTVLVVDDSVSVRHVMTNLVQKAGWTALQARDGVEALEVLHRSARRPDVILLDIEMPRMDGYELTSTLRSQSDYRDVPIVMVTSRAGDKHRQKGLATGATDYLVKPIQEDVLIERIQALVRAPQSMEGRA